MLLLLLLLLPYLSACSQQLDLLHLVGNYTRGGPSSSSCDE
jgi:hypothetical protein